MTLTVNSSRSESNKEGETDLAVEVDLLSNTITEQISLVQE